MSPELENASKAGLADHKQGGLRTGIDLAGGYGMRIIRVFPRRTKATPIDDMVRVNQYPGLFDEADEIHISVAFTWDLKRAECLERSWRQVAPTKIGGPAIGNPGGNFISGLYLKPGYVLTSRGCPNNCWFCSVWRREGRVIRELPITDGWNVLDDNLLACSEDHLKSVFAMLKQHTGKVEFTGGLEAKRLKTWQAEEIFKLKPKQIFFANDTPDDLDPLIEAGKILHSVGIKSHPSSHVLRAYVLCGYKTDTLEQAEARMIQTIEAGFMPMAMLYRDAKGDRDPQWMKWQRQWARPAIISSKMGRH